MTEKPFELKDSDYIYSCADTYRIIMREELEYIQGSDPVAFQDMCAVGHFIPIESTNELFDINNLNEPTGAEDDPILYIPGMQLIENKYYIQYDVLYICILGTDDAITLELDDVVDLYVEPIEGE